MRNVVVLDKISFSSGDIDLSCLDSLGNVSYYDVLDTEKVIEVCKDAEVVVCNKTVFDEYKLNRLPKLKFIALTATGYNNVDLVCAKKNGILVANVPNYSTDDVAQHVFAFILHYCNKISEYDASVKRGDWKYSKTFCYFNIPLIEIAGKTLGIIGFGNIGRKVAEIASAFGMKVLVYSRTKKQIHYEQVSLEEVFKNSDFLTLHCPLNEQTKNLVNEKTLSLMKKTSVLINTSRGGVIDEIALKNALENGTIAHAMLDVLQVEPMSANCPLFGAKNITITPHIAWAPKETRQRLMFEVSKNIQAFFDGEQRNCVNE